MFEPKKINIIHRDSDMASVIRQNNRENLCAFLKRMDLDFDPDWDKEVLALYLKDILLENPEYILSIYSAEVIEFLLCLWESDSIEAGRYEWAAIGQLKMLGLVDFRFYEEPEGSRHEIFLIAEAKDAFYFYLKSRTSRMHMERYEQWEMLVRGLLAHYGIISFQRLYFQFCRMIKSPVDDREFHRFLSVRLGMLQFGGFAFEKTSKVEYYQNYEIQNPETVLEKRQEMSSLDYYLPSEEAALAAAHNNGIGEWEGISALAQIFMEKMEQEYYKTVIMVKSCILMAQNDESFESILEQISTTYPETIHYKEEIQKAVYSLYQSVPVYSLKGWSRKEWKKRQRNRLPFTVVRGGKTDRD